MMVTIITKCVKEELPHDTVHHFIQLIFVTKIDEHLFYSDVRTHLHDNFVTNGQVTRHFYSLVEINLLYNYQ